MVKGFLRCSPVLPACLAVLASLLQTPPSQADPARFWFSVSENNPYAFSPYESHYEHDPLVRSPAATTIDLIPGASQTIYLWAQPQTRDPGPFSPHDATTPNPFRVLQNWALNLAASPSTSLVGDRPLKSVKVRNPTENNQPRYLTKVDSLTPFHTTNKFDQPISYPLSTPDGLELFAGFSLGDPSTINGVGSVCESGDCWREPGSPPAWLLAEIELQPSQLGDFTGALQIGQPSITHVGELQPETTVIFGVDDGQSYNAGNLDHRGTTLGWDTPDFHLGVTDYWPGDFDQNGKVDAADYSIWRQEASSTVASPLSDANGDGVVDRADYARWSANYGRTRPAMIQGDAAGVPEPTACLVAVSALLAVGVCLPKRSAVILVLAIALSATAPQASAVQLLSEWIGLSSPGWDDPLNWSTFDYPNNEADTYDVIIASGSGPMLSLGLDITIDELYLSTDMYVDSSLLQVLSPIQIDGGSLFAGPGANIASDIELVGPVSNLEFFGTDALVDKTVRLLHGGSTLSLNNMAAATFEIGQSGAVILNGSGATVSGFLGTNLDVNGTFRAEDSGLFMSINDVSNAGSFEVTGGTFTANLTGGFFNTGTIQVDSGARLEVLPGSTFTHSGSAVLRGSGVVSIDSNADGNVDFNDIFLNEATIRPGASPGILEIEGSFEQTADGVLEIEIDGTVPGTGHDQLLVPMGFATLGGRVDLLVGYSPTVGDTAKFLEALSVSGTFDRYRATGLSTNLGFELVYTGTDVTARFMTPTAIGFTPPLPTAVWSDASSWGGPSAPTSLSRVVLDSGAAVQTIRVLAPPAGAINAAHSVVVGGGDREINLQIESNLPMTSTSLSVSTETVVGSNGAIDILDAESELLSAAVFVNSGGRLRSAGAVTGDVVIGRNGSLADPARFELNGSPTIDGTLTQTSIGALELGIDGSTVADTHDRLAVTGDVSLDGLLQIDATGLTDAEFTPGEYYEVLRAESALAGEFAAVEVVGRDDIYFDVLYDASAPAAIGVGTSSLTDNGFELVRVGGFYKGDVVGSDGRIDDEDARVFAAVLLNNGATEVDLDGDGELDDWDRNAIIALDFVDLRQNTVTDDLVVDFYDVPYFAQAMATVNGMALSEAYARVQSAISEVSRNQVPEPNAVVLVIVLLVCGTNHRLAKR